MNDKMLKCITMMSYKIKSIHSSALCEKYGNNIAYTGQNIPSYMKYVMRVTFFPTHKISRQKVFVNFLFEIPILNNKYDANLTRLMTTPIPQQLSTRTCETAVTIPKNALSIAFLLYFP